MVTISYGFSISAVVLFIVCLLIILNSNRFSEKAFQYSLKICGILVVVCFIIAIATIGIKEGYREDDGKKLIRAIDLNNQPITRLLKNPRHEPDISFKNLLFAYVQLSSNTRIGNNRVIIIDRDNKKIYVSPIIVKNKVKFSRDLSRYTAAMCKSPSNIVPVVVNTRSSRKYKSGEAESGGEGGEEESFLAEAFHFIGEAIIDVLLKEGIIHKGITTGMRAGLLGLIIRILIGAFIKGEDVSSVEFITTLLKDAAIVAILALVGVECLPEIIITAIINIALSYAGDKLQPLINDLGKKFGKSLGNVMTTAQTISDTAGGVLDSVIGSIIDTGSKDQWVIEEAKPIKPIKAKPDCPSDKYLAQDIFGTGKMKCCPIGTNLMVDGETCCKTGDSFNTNPFGQSGCCPSGQKLQYDGKTCCKPGDLLSVNDKVTGCCPAGQKIQSDGTCCPAGEELVVMLNGQKKCCKIGTGCCESGKKLTDSKKCCDPAQILNDPTGTSCCGDGFHPSNIGNIYGCCQNGWEITKNKTCCPKERLNKNGECCTAGTVSSTNSAGMNKCCPSDKPDLTEDGIDCCQKGSNLAAGSHCCPAGTTYSKVTSSLKKDYEFCCKQGEHASVSKDFGYTIPGCCPNGTDIINNKAGYSKCCPPGKILDPVSNNCADPKPTCKAKNCGNGTMDPTTCECTCNTGWSKDNEGVCNRFECPPGKLPLVPNSTKCYSFEEVYQQGNFTCTNGAECNSDIINTNCQSIGQTTCNCPKKHKAWCHNDDPSWECGNCFGLCNNMSAAP